MAASKKPARRRAASGKVSKAYRLTPGKLAAAQRILGAAAATEAIETALDMVVFRQALIDGTAAMSGTGITPSDPA